MDHLGKLDQVIDYLKRSSGTTDQTNFVHHISSRYNVDVLLEKLKGHFGSEVSTLNMDRHKGPAEGRTAYY